MCPPLCESRLHTRSTFPGVSHPELDTKSALQGALGHNSNNNSYHLLAHSILGSLQIVT